MEEVLLSPRKSMGMMAKPVSLLRCTGDISECSSLQLLFYNGQEG